MAAFLPRLKDGFALVKEQDGVVDLGLAEYELEVLPCTHAPKRREVDEKDLCTANKTMGSPLEVSTRRCVADLLAQLIGQGVGHHGLTCTRGAMEEHHHPCPIGDGVIQTHPLPATLEALKVAHRVEDETLLLLTEDHLRGVGWRTGPEGWWWRWGQHNLTR